MERTQRNQRKEIWDEILTQEGAFRLDDLYRNLSIKGYTDKDFITEVVNSMYLTGILRPQEDIKNHQTQIDGETRGLFEIV